MRRRSLRGFSRRNNNERTLTLDVAWDQPCSEFRVVPHSEFARVNGELRNLALASGFDLSIFPFVINTHLSRDVHILPRIFRSLLLRPQRHFHRRAAISGSLSRASVTFKLVGNYRHAYRHFRVSILLLLFCNFVFVASRETRFREARTYVRGKAGAENDTSKLHLSLSCEINLSEMADSP